MVNGTSSENTQPHVENDSSSCPFPEQNNNSSLNNEGEFNWDHATQGIILSSFYYGYMCTQFIGGILVRYVGARVLFAIGIGGASALTLLNPVAARTNYGFLIALRVVEGMLEGVTFPCSHYILSNWSPQNERSILVSFPLSGSHIGTVIAAPLTGLLCTYGFDGGWASSFYVFGGIGMLWSIGWLYFIRDTPAKHPTISAEERAYIEAQCQSSTKHVSIRSLPWKSIALSPAVWAVVVAHTCYLWNYYTLLTEIPTYLKDVMHISSNLNGLVTSLPYICVWLMQGLASIIADYLRKKGVRTRNVRKLSYGFGMILSSVCLIVISYVGCNTGIVVMLLCFAVGISGFGYMAYVVNHVDFAPQYASILMGISNTFGTLPGILSPILTGAIINQESSIATWQIIFFISAGVSLFGALIFALFARGEVQSWAVVADDEKGEESKPILASSEDDDETSFKSEHYGAT